MKNADIIKHLDALYGGVLDAQYVAEANSAWLSTLLRTSSAAGESEILEQAKKLKLSQERMRLLRSQLPPH
jgi:hypothetical protein